MCWVTEQNLTFDLRCRSSDSMRSILHALSKPTHRDLSNDTPHVYNRDKYFNDQKVTKIRSRRANSTFVQIQL